MKANSDLFNEAMRTTAFVNNLQGIYSPISDFVYSLKTLPNKELPKYFLDVDDLYKLIQACEVIDKVSEAAFNYARKKTIEVIKAQNK